MKSSQHAEWSSLLVCLELLCIMIIPRDLDSIMLLILHQFLFTLEGEGISIVILMYLWSKAALRFLITFSRSLAFASDIFITPRKDSVKWLDDRNTLGYFYSISRTFPPFFTSVYNCSCVVPIGSNTSDEQRLLSLLFSHSYRSTGKVSDEFHDKHIFSLTSHLRTSSVKSSTSSVSFYSLVFTITTSSSSASEGTSRSTISIWYSSSTSSVRL